MSRTTSTFLIIVGCAIAGAAWLLALIPADPIVDTLTGNEDTLSVPPASTVTVSIASSVTKQKWMEAVAQRFHESNPRTEDGAAIRIEVSGVLSGGSMWKILDGTLKPVVWSPGAVSWTEQLGERWSQLGERPLTPRDCEATVYSPIGLAMWRPMAEALGWPDQPIGWQTIVDLAASPQGWARLGHPEWGRLKLGHPHPKYSSAGMLYMASLAYGVSGKTDGLTPADVYDPKVETAMRNLAANTAKYGMVSTDLLSMMARHGPGFLHAVSAFEEGTVRLNIARTKELRWPMVFVFPAEGTFWSSHPYCILDGAQWVDERQARAAGMFLEFLRAEPQQQVAVTHLLRPLDQSIPIGAPLSLDNGADPRVRIDTVPPLEPPGSKVTAAIIDQFMTTKRKSTALLVLDVSASMRGEKMRAATAATAAFIERLHPEDEVGLMTFNSSVNLVHAVSPAHETADELQNRVSNLIAQGGTGLYEAVCQSMDEMRRLRAADEAAAEQRLYGVVLLSDGRNTGSGRTENQMFTRCLPGGAEADNIKIFPIAFGDDANDAVLERVASVSGGRIYSADPTTIERTYLRISAEQ